MASKMKNQLKSQLSISSSSSQTLVKPPVDLNFQSKTIEENGQTIKASRLETGTEYLRNIYPDAKTLYEVIQRGARESKSGRCLGKKSISTGEYTWISYEQVLERIKNFGAGLQKIGLKPGQETYVGIFASNCPEYTITEYACYQYSMVVVPIYDSYGPEGFVNIINQVKLSCILCDKDVRFHALVTQANQLKSLSNIIMTTPILESYKSKAASYDIKVHTMSEIEALGKESPRPTLRPTSDDIAVICYTSGTTGTPKGVILSHGNIIADISGVMAQLADHQPNVDDVLISYLPLAHMFQRCCEAALLMVGGCIGYYSGDVKNITEDMRKLRPTVFPVVPRLLTRIHDKVLAAVKGNKIKGLLLTRALRNKKDMLGKSKVSGGTVWDRVVFKSVRDELGGRVRLTVCGSAPLSPEILTFARCALGCIVCEGYGQTECVCPCTLTFPGDHSTGHVGPPLHSCQIKLVDVPDMDYQAKDGHGEICVRGPIVFKGYFKEPELTLEVLDSDGWLHTGDIGSWLPNGTLRIIDRKRNIFKLSQGEYVAPERVESVYIKSEYVGQLFVYGDPLKSSLVAIVVPNMDIVEVWSRDHDLKGPIRDLCKHPWVKMAILQDLVAIGRQSGLNGFELVKDIYVHPDQFSIENGLLTPTMKIRRGECKKFFATQIEEMYKSLN